ncbi:TPM domain-containing protein [bacterium]|nr:TPM domain-containing protein [bacterium]
MSTVKSKLLLLTLFCVFVLYHVSIFGADRYPNYTGYVNDFARVLNSSEKGIITNLITELEKKTSAEIAIVTVSNIEGSEINIYKNGLFEKWKIGKKGKDNGVLIVLAMKERKVGIEVGYGLEGVLPDGLCGEIIRKQMSPNFKAGQFGKGLVSAVATISNLVAKEYNVKLSGLNSLPRTAYVVRKRSAASSIASIIFALLFLMLILGSRTGLLGVLLFGSMTGRGGYWGGGGSGGFGGGFGGFGGGMSGGGGASGSW